MNKPRVSVLMPVYNGERYIRQAIDSILFQYYKDFELIIVNDGSTDGTQVILETYSDPRIRIVKNSSKSGLANVRNQLIRESQGEFLCWLDADDIADRRRLQLQVDFLDKNPGINLVCTNACSINENNDRINWRWWSTKGATAQLEMLWSNPIAQSSVTLRKECLVHNNLSYDSSCPPAEDYDLFTRLSIHGRIERIDPVLLRYRVTKTGSFSNAQERAFTISIASNERLVRLVTGNRIDNQHFELLPWPNTRKQEYDMKALSAWLLFLIEKGCRYWNIEWTERQIRGLAQEVLCRYIYRKECRRKFLKNFFSLFDLFGCSALISCTKSFIRIITKRGVYL